MTSVTLPPFELNLPDVLTVADHQADRLALTSTDPLLLVNCTVASTHPDATDGRAALIAANHAAGDLERNGARVVGVFRVDQIGYGIVLEGRDGLERLLAFALQQDRQVLLVLARSPMADAERAGPVLQHLVDALATAARRQQPDREPAATPDGSQLR